MIIHFSGGLDYCYRGTQHIRLAGWACCASGDRAYSIRAKGNHTSDETLVTCKACLRHIDHARLDELGLSTTDPGVTK